MAYYNSLWSDLRRAGLGLGSDLITSLFIKPKLMKQAAELEQENVAKRLGAAALLSGLATTPAGPEHVAGQEALKKLGIDLPLLSVPTKVPQTPEEYGAAKKLTIPGGTDFTPPQREEMRSKLVGLSPGSVDQVLARLALKERPSLSDLFSAKTAGMGLMEKILLMQATKGTPTATEVANLKRNLLKDIVDKDYKDTTTGQRDRALERQDEAAKARAQEVYDQLAENLELATDEPSAINYYRRMTQLREKYPELPEPQIPDRWSSWREHIPEGFPGHLAPPKERFMGKGGSTSQQPKSGWQGPAYYIINGKEVAIRTKEEYDRITGGK